MMRRRIATARRLRSKITHSKVNARCDLKNASRSYERNGAKARAGEPRRSFAERINCQLATTAREVLRQEEYRSPSVPGSDAKLASGERSTL